MQCTVLYYISVWMIIKSYAWWFRFNDFVAFLETYRKTSPQSDGVFNHFLTQFGQKTNWAHLIGLLLSYPKWLKYQLKLVPLIHKRLERNHACVCWGHNLSFFGLAIIHSFISQIWTLMTPFERSLSKLSVKLFPLTEVIATERVRKLHACMCLLKILF